MALPLDGAAIARDAVRALPRSNAFNCASYKWLNPVAGVSDSIGIN